MKLDGEYTFEAPREEVWKALVDPEVLASIMPGCEKLELVDGVYKGVLKVKVGPVQGKFNGKVELRDIEETKGYRMNVDGKGQQGFVKADAGVVLQDLEGGRTHMSYDADAKVGGKIAGVGQRLVDASAKAIIKQSLEGLHETVKARHAYTQTTEEAQRAAAEAEDAKTAGDEASARRAAERAAEAKAKADAGPAEVKQKTQAQLAAAVAAEVGKELVPAPVRYAVIALIVIAAAVGLILAVG